MEGGIPTGPVYSLDRVFADPQVRQQGMVEEIDHPGRRRAEAALEPIRMDAFEGRTVRTPPPLLGEHNRDVLAEYGFPAEAIAALEARRGHRRRERVTRPPPQR